MDEKNISTKRQEEIFRNIFLGNVIIIILLLLLNVVEIEFIIERAKNIFSFWILIFLIIFLPRRILRKSKKFRYIVLYIRKNYPKVFYYYKFSITDWIYGIFQILEFYLERILKYFLIGTKIKKLKPYKENWEKGEFILRIIVEIFRWIQYIILYIYKIFYEIIIFFDTASIYKIVRSRILGFMMVTIGYIILGVNFFIIYVLSWIIGFFIYTGIHIYVNYKRTKKKSYDLETLSTILILFGYVNYLVLIDSQIIKLKAKGKILFYPIKFKRSFYFNSIKRKYGAQEATKCCLTVGGITVVRKDNFVYIDIGEASKKKIEYIYISKNKFFTDFYLKRKWYRNSSNIFEITWYNCFNNSLNWMEDTPNIMYHYLWFVSDVFSCFTLEEEKINEINEIQCKKEFNEFWNQETEQGKFYLRYCKEFFEFKELYKFVKIFEKKKNELGFKGFKEKLEEMNYFENKYFLYRLGVNELIEMNEFRFLMFELNKTVLDVLNIEYSEEEYKKAIIYHIKEGDRDYDIFKEKLEKKIQEIVDRYSNMR